MDASLHLSVGTCWANQPGSHNRKKVDKAGVFFPIFSTFHLCVLALSSLSREVEGFGRPFHSSTCLLTIEILRMLFPHEVMAFALTDILRVSCPNTTQFTYRFDLTAYDSCQKVSRLPTEPQG